MKSSTAKTLKSQEWSTEAMTEGFAHILSDAAAELPDDLDQLQETLCHPIMYIREDLAKRSSYQKK